MERSTHVPLHETLPAVHKQRPAVQTLPAPQLAFVMHETQMFVAVSQYGVFPLQVVLSVHWTHWPPLHAGWPVPVQLVLVRHSTQ